MIQTQTFEFNKSKKDEMEVIARALWLIGQKRYDDASKVLTLRHDILTRDGELKLYDQRAP